MRAGPGAVLGRAKQLGAGCWERAVAGPGALHACSLPLSRLLFADPFQFKDLRVLRWGGAKLARNLLNVYRAPNKLLANTPLTTQEKSA
jgi:hypothetical protein